MIIFVHDRSEQAEKLTGDLSEKDKFLYEYNWGSGGRALHFKIDGQRFLRMGKGRHLRALDPRMKLYREERTLLKHSHISHYATSDVHPDYRRIVHIRGCCHRNLSLERPGPLTSRDTT
jgi:hypothetical protein